MKQNKPIILLILLTFFIISFFTNVLGALNPSVSKAYDLSETLVSFLPFCLFIAYGIMSIPAGVLVEKRGPKKVILGAFMLCAAASLLFAIVPRFPVYLFSLFAIGTGMAALQVVINPLLRVAGGPQHYAFNSILAQLVFGLASFFSPLVFSWLVTGDLTGIEQGLQWVSIYWLMAVCGLLMFVLVLFYTFPPLDDNAEPGSERKDYRSLLKQKKVWFFFFGIFSYVGVEQGISFWMSSFLENYHGFNPETAGASAVSWFWGYMTIGGLLGLVLLRLMDSRNVLKGFTTLAAATLAIGLFGPAEVSYYALQLCGFFLAVMYPIIISLALNSVADKHGAFAGILMSGIMGGAVLQLLIGALSDIFSLKIGMLFIFPALAYIFLVAWKARPLVTNALRSES